MSQLDSKGEAKERLEASIGSGFESEEGLELRRSRMKNVIDETRKSLQTADMQGEAMDVSPRGAVLQLPYSCRTEPFILITTFVSRLSSRSRKHSLPFWKPWIPSALALRCSIQLVHSKLRLCVRLTVREALQPNKADSDDSG